MLITEIAFNLSRCKGHTEASKKNPCACMRELRLQVTTFLSWLDKVCKDNPDYDFYMMLISIKEVKVIPLGKSIKGLLKYLDGKVRLRVMDIPGQTVPSSLTVSCDLRDYEDIVKTYRIDIGAIIDGDSKFLSREDLLSLTRYGRMSRYDMMNLLNKFLMGTESFAFDFAFSIESFRLFTRTKYKKLLWSSQIPCFKHRYRFCDCRAEDRSRLRQEVNTHLKGVLVAFVETKTPRGVGYGLTLLGDNLKNMFDLSVSIDEYSYYTTSHNICAVGSSPAHVISIVFREVKSEKHLLKLDSIIKNEKRKLTSEEITRYSKSVLPYLNKN